MINNDTHLTAADVGLDNGSGAHITGYGNDDGSLDVVLVDYLAFHTYHVPELFDGDEGWMTSAAATALEELARPRFAAAVDNGGAGWGGDDPHVAYVWNLPDVKSPEEAGERVWPMLARALNETDPGTFGARYIYADVAKELS